MNVPRIVFATGEGGASGNVAEGKQVVPSERIVIRVAGPGRAAFQLRKGEQGISVFDPAAVAPPLSEAEILASFRAGSQIMTRRLGIIEAKGLRVIPVEGALTLRQAHREIVPGPGMTRGQYKAILQELE